MGGTPASKHSLTRSDPDLPRVKSIKDFRGSRELKEALTPDEVDRSEGDAKNPAEPSINIEIARHEAAQRHEDRKALQRGAGKRLSEQNVNYISKILTRDINECPYT